MVAERAGFCYVFRMKTNRFPYFAVSVAALVLVNGCAVFGSKKAETPALGEEEAFTPVRSKYMAVTPADLPATMEAMRIAVVDVDFKGGTARLGFFPAVFHPKTGFCQILEERAEADSIAALVKAIDPYIDRMPFCVLFTYAGKPTSDPDVAETLPPAYADFFRQFQTAMKDEDIDFLCLLPESATFLR